MTEEIKIELIINLDRLVLGGYAPKSQDTDGETYSGATSFEAIIADQAAEQLLKALSWEDKRNIKQRIAEIRDEEIRKHLDPIIRSVIESPVQTTNNWGEPTGEPESLRDVIIKRANETLNAKVDRDGRQSSRGNTLLERVIEREVGYAFNKELKDVIEVQKKTALKLLEKMTGHTMSVKLDRDTVVLTPVCHEPEGGNKCRLVCDSGCDSWDWDHGVFDGEEFKDHKLVDVGYCNAVTFITNDDCSTAELYAGNDEISLHDNMPITVHWRGDGYEWKKTK